MPQNENLELGDGHEADLENQLMVEVINNLQNM